MLLMDKVDVCMYACIHVCMYLVTLSYILSLSHKNISYKTFSIYVYVYVYEYMKAYQLNNNSWQVVTYLNCLPNSLLYSNNIITLSSSSSSSFSLTTHMHTNIHTIHIYIYTNIHTYIHTYSSCVLYAD